MTATAGASEATSFRVDIEGLRGVAVAAVVMYHFGFGVRGGFVGVDVFFVISGYLITLQLLRRGEGRLGSRLADFYARRIRRLFPAASVALLGTLLASLLLLSPLELYPLAGTAKRVAVYVSNLRFAAQALDYQNASATDPMLHTWSLAVEEQFYVVWPLLIFALSWISGRRVQRVRLHVMGLALISLASFALCVYWTKTRQPWAFFLMPARAWEFGVGGLVAVVFGGASVTRARRTLAWTGTCLIVFSAFLLSSRSEFPSFNAVWPVAGAAMLIATNPRNDAWPGKALATR